MRRSAVVGCLSSLLAACGGDAASAAPEQAPESRLGLPEEPWERISPDSLYGATALENLRVTRAVLDVAWLPEGWEGMRIAAISDLQLGLWEDNERVATEAVRRAVGANPDLVVLLGDYIAEGRDTAALARVLAPLRGRAALAVLGDRDVRSDSVAAMITRTLSRSGVRVLRNGAAPITRNGSTAQIAGLDPDVADDPWASQEYVLATVGGGAETPVLLTHMAPLASRAPEGRYAAVLAGNTFCGPLEVPGTPRLSWLQEEALPGGALPGIDRIFRVEGSLLFVTCGVGYSFLPARLGGQPEVALVVLRSVERDQEEIPADTTVADSILRAQGTDTVG